LTAAVRTVSNSRRFTKCCYFNNRLRIRLPAVTLSGNDPGQFIYTQTFKLACLVYQSLSGNAPRYLADDIHLLSESDRHQLRSSSTRTCIVPITHNSYRGDRSFAATGPRLWNSLPSHLQHSGSGYSDFKCQLKTFLFRQTAAQQIVTLVLCAAYKYSYLLTYLHASITKQYNPVPVTVKVPVMLCSWEGSHSTGRSNWVVTVTCIADCLEIEISSDTDARIEYRTAFAFFLVSGLSAFPVLNEFLYFHPVVWLEAYCLCPVRLCIRSCVHPETLLTQYLAEYLTHFRQTYINDALWDREE